MKKCSRRDFLRLAGAGCAGLAATLAGCATPTAVEKVVTKEVVKKETVVVEVTVAPVEAEPIEITYWSNFGPNYGGGYEEAMVETFKDVRPEITVNRSDMLPREKVVAEFAAGRHADMMPWYYPEIKSAGRQLALNDLIDGDQWDVCQMWLVFKDPADDRIYGVNQEVSNTALWYDRAVLAELGVEEPSNPDWTWEEFIDFAQTATVDTNGRNAKDSQFSPDDVKVFGTNVSWHRSTCWAWLEWLWQAGGDFYNEDETQVIFDSPEGIAACQLYVDLIHKYRAMALPGSLAGGLGSGLLASTQTGNWSYGSLVRAQGLDMGAIDLPQNATKASLILPGYWHLLNNGADKVKAAWEWLKYRTNVANVLMFSEGAGYLPIRRDVVASNAYQMFLDNQAPQLRVHTDLLAIGRVQPTTHLFRSQLMKIHGEWFERAVLGDTSAEEAMKSAAAEINSQPELFEQATVQGPAC